ncbi:MAG: transcription antitermination protein NusB [Muribaculaceae bacterium]|nr:transcription antitermination protein NusB [Muribaculaceae bacterium]
MINRSLIRIKTVQILYSYLLTRTDFKLETAPQGNAATRDNLFAYSVYLDFIFLLLKLSGQPLGTDSGIAIMPDATIQKNRVGAALRNNPDVAALIAGHRAQLPVFDSCLSDIANDIIETEAYKEYKRKRKHTMADDVAFWTKIYSTIIRRSKSIERILRQNDDFSHVGFEAGLKMFCGTLDTFDDTRSSYTKATNDLAQSLTQAYNLYHALLYLPVVITEAMQIRQDEAKNKYLPTPEELNPNTRLVDNLFVKAVKDNKQINEYMSDNDTANPENWRDIELAVDKMLDTILATDAYKKYAESKPGDFATDASFWREILKTVILPSDELSELLESSSVYWNDDLNIMGTFVLKTIRRSYASADDEASENPRENGQIVILPKFMNKDDEAFGGKLFEYVVNNRTEYRRYIDSFIDTRQWDTERLAFMDIVIMLTAIAELIHFPSIPVPVTMNEYIEIANDYSTARSGQFINGILYSVIKLLNEKGIIDKK